MAYISLVILRRSKSAQASRLPVPMSKHNIGDCSPAFFGDPEDKGNKVFIWRCNMNRCGRVLVALSILFVGNVTSLGATAANPGQDEDKNDASEVWGGPDVRLRMNSQGASVEFDCADGKILQPIKADANGDFTARGTYTPGQFGAIQKDHPLQEMPAIYKGKISGDAMQLQVIIEKKEMEPAPFTLTRGKNGRVVRCH